jgi:hypothetical protein
MSCSPFDLKDYFLKELTGPQQLQMEVHIHGCRRCGEELERLRLTEAAMFTLRDEEIPQRIAFVSDQVFEPSPWRRWWGALWGSSARLGFAAAAMLSAAIVFATVTGTVSEVRIQQRVDRAVNTAVEKAVAARTREVAMELEQAEASFEMAQRRDQVRYLQATYFASPDKGEKQ